LKAKVAFYKGKLVSAGSNTLNVLKI